MESVRLLKLSLKYMKTGKKKQSKKLQKNNSTSDPQPDLIATPHGMYSSPFDPSTSDPQLDLVATPHDLYSPSDPSTPASSSIIPLLSPVYIVFPPQFPDSEDRSARMGSSDRSPQRDWNLNDMRTLSSKRQPSPIKLVDSTKMIVVFQPPCVL